MTSKFARLFKMSTKYAIAYCYLCNKPIMSVKEASLDHDKPIKRFNDKSDGNLNLTHKWCNKEKGMLTTEEYRIWKLFEAVRNGNKDKAKIDELWKICLAIKGIVHENNKKEK